MNEDQRKIFQSLIYPSLFVIVIWLVKIIEVIFGFDLRVFGLQPLHLAGLLGIITSPLIHENFSHLFANSIPLFVLSGLLFYFYRVIAWRIVILSALLTGIWVWFIGSGDSIHIGVSGVVYALASFLFLSGIIRRDTKLMAITLLIAFLYGGMVWGVFPQLFPRERISWESHLMGIVAGVVLAVYFRKAGPQRTEYQWDEDNEEDNPEEYQGYEEEPEESPPNP